MTKCFCDRCGKEIKHKYQFKYLCHIEDTANPLTGHCDSDGNRVSEREIIKDLCARCYNKVMTAAYKAYQK